MTASTHKKIRKSDKFWVTKINKKGKQSLVAPVVVEDGPVLMASTTVGTQASSSDFIFYKGGYSKNTRMSFIIDTTKNPDNSADKTIIVPFTLYTPSYQFTIDWGDGTSTTYPANAALTTVGLTHTYSTAGQYTIVITSDEQKIPVLNWSTSGNVGGNKHKLIQLSTPLITFDTSCPNSNSAQYFAYECDNLLFIATQFFINNPQIRNYDYCFSKCSKLVKIPYDLFKYVKYQSSYQEVFAHDIVLQTVPDDLFATAKGLDFSGAFSGDSNLVLDVNLERFFGTEPYINTDVHEIFRDCVKTTGDAEEFAKFFTRYVAYVDGDGEFDTGWGILTGKIYAQPIYNSDGKLVRDLVPAKTGNFYGGRIAPQDCLWDEVEQEFLLPTSPFVYGVEVDDNYVIKDGNIEFANPDIYLQSSGTQYIDTGLTRTGLTDTYRYITSLSYQDNQSRQINGSQGFCYFGCISGYYQVTQASSAHLNLQCPLDEFVDMDILFDCPNQTCAYTIGDTTGNISNCGYSTESKEIYLFNISNLGFYNKCKMKGTQLYKNSELVRKFIPVPTGLQIGSYTVPSNGMWDTVTKTFFENKGTGSFTIGGLSTDTERENNLPYSFKKNALYKCELWSNYAIPERVWTGIPSSNDEWLATDGTKQNWILVDPENMLLLAENSGSILCSPTDAIMADEYFRLGWKTGNAPDIDFTRGIIKPDTYATVEVLRNIINALPELRGYVVVGNPTIVDGVVSGFSARNYLTIPAPNLSTSNDWEMATKANIPRLSDTFQVLFTGSLNHQFAGIDIDGNGFLGAAIGNSSGDGWQIIENSTNWVGTRKRVPLNTDFWAKLTFNGSKYSVYYSEDGENWEETVYFNSTQKVYHDPTNVLSIGIGRSLQGLVFYGSIDLNNTYIKINNKVWFDGTEKLNEVVDLSGCINKGGLTSADLQKVTDKGYGLLLN